MHHFSHITAQHRDYPSPLRRQQYQPHYDYPSTFYFRPQKKPVRVLVLVLVLVMMTRLFFVTDAQQDYGDEKNNSPGKLVVMKSAKSTWSIRRRRVARTCSRGIEACLSRTGTQMMTDPFQLTAVLDEWKWSRYSLLFRSPWLMPSTRGVVSCQFIRLLSWPDFIQHGCGAMPDGVRRVSY